MQSIRHTCQMTFRPLALPSVQYFITPSDLLISLGEILPLYCISDNDNSPEDQQGQSTEGDTNTRNNPFQPDLYIIVVTDSEKVLECHI